MKIQHRNVSFIGTFFHTLEKMLSKQKKIYSIKSYLAPFIHNFADFTNISLYLAKKKKVMRVIMFHGVGGDECPTNAFIAQLKYLNHYFSIVEFDALLSKIKNPIASTNHEISLTFDDGLRNNYTIAYPILKSMNIPATFFVCPGLIENQKWLWNHEVRERLNFMSINERQNFIKHLKLSNSDPLYVVELMKSLITEKRNKILQDLRYVTKSFNPSKQQKMNCDIMNWDELNDMDSRLITIGSHTTTHTILTTCTSKELHDEIHGSRSWLEQSIQRPVKHFCYPNGDFNDTVMQCVSDVYDSAVTVNTGFSNPGDDLYKLKRISTDKSLSKILWRLHRPTA
jgi:peptidoglycan/xylan/chitin deacetylase (PgdA/CDA1 family)